MNLWLYAQKVSQKYGIGDRRTVKYMTVVEVCYCSGRTSKYCANLIGNKIEGPKPKLVQ